MTSNGFFNICTGPEIELDFIEGLTNQFERKFATLPSEMQASWQRQARVCCIWTRLCQVANLVHAPNPRLASLGRLVLAHQQQQLPIWWISHQALLCKPCTFASRGLCRNGELCSFCHAPGGSSKGCLDGREDMIGRLDLARRSGSGGTDAGKRWQEPHRHRACRVDTVADPVSPFRFGAMRVTRVHRLPFCSV